MMQGTSLLPRQIGVLQLALWEVPHNIHLPLLLLGRLLCLYLVSIEDFSRRRVPPLSPAHRAPLTGSPSSSLHPRDLPFSAYLVGAFRRRPPSRRPDSEDPHPQSSSRDLDGSFASGLFLISSLQGLIVASSSTAGARVRGTVLPPLRTTAPSPPLYPPPRTPILLVPPPPRGAPLPPLLLHRAERDRTRYQ